MMIRELTALPGVTVLSDVDFPGVLKLWPGVFSDFGDSLLAASAKSVNDCTVVTFDRKFKAGLKTLGVETAE